MTVFYNMTNAELLHYVDRSDPIAEELAARLEEALAEIDFLKSFLPDEDLEIDE